MMAASRIWSGDSSAQGGRANGEKELDWIPRAAHEARFGSVI